MENIFLPIAIGIVSCTFLGVVIYKVETSMAWVIHSDEVISLSESIMRVMTDAQSSYRGYLLNADSRSLARYRRAEVESRERFDKLKTLVADNNLQLDRAQQVESLSDQWFAASSPNIEVARSSRAKALAEFNDGTGQEKFGELRAEMGLLTAEEFRLRGARISDLAKTAWVSLVAFVVFIILGNIVIAIRGRRSLFRISSSYGAVVAQNEEQLRDLQKRAELQELESQISIEMIKTETAANVAEFTLRFALEKFGALAGVLLLRGNGSGDDVDWSTAARVGVGSAVARQEENALREKAFSSGAPVLMENFKGHQWNLVTELGTHEPRFLFGVPLLFSRKPVGYLELAFNQEPSAQTRQFFIQSGEKIASIINNELSKDRMVNLNLELRAQQTELESQQEELRTANEALELRSDLLRRAQETTDAINAELEEANAKLVEQARDLEEQREELLKRNQEMTRARASLETQAKELEIASRHKSQFLANMSHELRTPLNSSMILSQLLLENGEGNLTSRQLENVRQIFESGQTLLALINDILDLSKVESGVIQWEMSKFHLGDLLNWSSQVFQPLTKEKGLTFKIDRPDANPEIISDQTRIRQVLTNLLSNAVKFTERGEVHLSARVDDAPEAEHGAVRMLRVEIRDTGIGISEEQLEVIFDPFRQADETITRKFGGTGLGLTISRNLAENLGGRIEVESRPGHGSKFILTLPLDSSAIVASSGDRLRTDSQPTSMTHLSTDRPSGLGDPLGSRAPSRSGIGANASDSDLILVIEDDDSFSAILKEHIEQCGLRCEVAVTAEHGQALAISKRPRAILLDINLPDYSGLVVLDRLKSNPETRLIPVHVISVAESSKLIENLGATEVLKKPVSLARLRDLVEKVSGSRVDRPQRSILVVDDDEVALAELQPKLESLGVQVALARSGNEALKMIAEGERYSCLVLDFKLSDMNGAEFLKQLRANVDWQKIPHTIVHTAADLNKSEQQMLDSVVNSLIVKGGQSTERLLDEVSLFLRRMTNLSKDPAADRVVRASEGALNGCRTLLVDDDPRNIHAIRAALESAGATVDVAFDGRQALEILRSRVGEFDAVLMDIMMPVMDGLQAIEAIRGDAKISKIPIIALTAKAMKNDQDECIRAGANDYLSKPIDIQRLFSLLRVWTAKL